MKFRLPMLLFAAASLLSAGMLLTAEGFQPTGSMKQARLFHTATLLNDGRVLVVGGVDPTKKATNPDALISALTSVEIYDPAAGTWSEGAPLAEPRYGHTATLLANGEVLVTGGRSTYYDFLGSAFGGMASATIYDPFRDTWHPVTAMALGHFLHTATLLPDGRVLIAGGDYDYNHGNDDPASLTFYASESEFFDPVTESWSPVGPFFTTTGYHKTGRFGHGALLLPSHQVLVVGGREIQPGWGGSVWSDYWNTELFRPETGSWKPANHPLSFCFRPMLQLLEDGTVLLASWDPYFSIAAGYDPVLDLWTSAPTSAQVHQSACGVSLADGRLLVAGGLAAGEIATDSNPPLTSCEIFSPLTRQWNATGAMKTGRANGTLTRLQDDRILAAGGCTEPTTELFVPDPKPRLSVRRTGDQPALLLEDTAGQPCVIEYKESLGSTIWSVLATFPHPEATQTVSSLPATARFFRARRTD